MFSDLGLRHLEIRADADWAGTRAESGLPLVIARLWNPVGPGLSKHFALASFAQQIATLPRSAGTLHVGNLDVERDFLDVRESVRLIAALGCNTAARGQVVNVCSGRSYRLRPPSKQ